MSRSEGYLSDLISLEIKGVGIDGHKKLEAKRKGKDKPKQVPYTEPETRIYAETVCMPQIKIIQN